MLRHTFATNARQTLDRGKPVSDSTVAAWLGHEGEKMLVKRYGHRISRKSDRHRTEGLEFRAESFAVSLRSRLAALYAATNVNAPEEPAAHFSAGLHETAGDLGAHGEMEVGRETERGTRTVVGAPERADEDHAQMSGPPSPTESSRGEGVTKIGYPETRPRRRAVLRRGLTKVKRG